MKKVISEASSKYLAFRRVSMSSKRRFGTAYHLLNVSGKLFLKEESGVRLGGTALDSGGRKVGIVFDLFFPISSSFSEMKPARSCERDMSVTHSSWG